MECFKWIISHSSAEELIQICATIWACWYARNVAIFEGSTKDITQLSISFTNMVHEYQIYSQKVILVNNPSSHSHQSWQTPNRGWVKINFDAHILPTFGRRLGIVIRDHEGKVLVTGTRSVDALWPVDTSEAAAAL